MDEDHSKTKENVSSKNHSLKKSTKMPEKFLKTQQQQPRKSLIITPKQKLSIETTSVKQQQKQQQKSLNLINTKSSSITTKNDIKSQIINGKLFKGKIITTTSISPKNIDLSSSSTVASSISSDFSSPIKINVSKSNSSDRSPITTTTTTKSKSNTSKLFKKSEQSCHCRNRNSLMLIKTPSSSPLSSSPSPSSTQSDNIILNDISKLSFDNQKSKPRSQKNFYLDLFRKMFYEYFYSTDFIGFICLNILTISIVLIIKWVRNR
ncbi:hypothetical protein DERP_015066 [Dermatophagoides pteronyssinus]|uniref:Uncharacterized protein n=1 Tax=Dermatophagoides pteronyssinus TaxID=6956 RepID=A0ABQ8JS89_DERPT|nr:hypothetical protein DERP_015066 [Dermatophagoides pteronyssinus]